MMLPDDTAPWNPVELLGSVRQAEPGAAWSLFAAALRQAGFEQSFYAFGVPITSRTPLRDKLTRGVHGEAQFLSDLVSQTRRNPAQIANDPVSVHCKTSLSPFAWRCTELTKNDRSALRFAFDVGVSSFLVVPFRNDDATQYGNLTVLCTDERHKSWMKHARRFGPLLQVTAQCFHDSLTGWSDDAPDGSRPLLSLRQRECLLWASRGFSTKQIANRLALSEPVVNEYMLVAKRKLGCATRTHAVARAIMLNLIYP